MVPQTPLALSKPHIFFFRGDDTLVLSFPAFFRNISDQQC